MLRVRDDQIRALQAQLDDPLVQAYVEALRPEADRVGMSEPILVARVRTGIAHGRRLGAPDGFALDATVALSVFLDPTWPEAPEMKAILDDDHMSREAQLRFITTTLLTTPPTST